MRVMMRHGSAAPDMQRLIELAREHPQASRYMMLVSDEIDPNDLIDSGHLDEKVRMAIAAGIDPVVALQMVTINPANTTGSTTRSVPWHRPSGRRRGAG